MIASFFPEENKNCRTDGCSCCSMELNIKDDQEEILKEVFKNIKVAKKVLAFYKIDFNKFVNTYKEKV